jgi:hypothetical protein
MARRNYYVPAPVARAAPTPPAIADEVELEPIIGRAAIAAELKITVKQLDQIIYADPRRPTSGEKAPIRKVPGLGVVADRTILLAWWRRTLRGDTAVPPKPR